jgi:hypothetical protein
MPKITVEGQSLTRGVQRFNNWLEPFLVEAAMPLLIIGFITGTIDLLTGGSIANSGLFKYIWAVVQATAIDGLFFSVWLQVRRASWSTWKEGLRATALVLIGVTLGAVALMVNDILSLQQVNGVASSVAMQSLDISPVVFTHIRATLVVVVAILVALVREDHVKEQAIQVTLEQAIALKNEEIDGLRATVDRLQTKVTELEATATKSKRGPRTPAIEAPNYEHGRLRAIAEKATGYKSASYAAQGEGTMDYGNDQQQVMNKATHDSDTQAPNYEHGGLRAMRRQGYIAQDDGATIAVANSDGQVMIATGSHRDRIKQAMLQAMTEGRTLNYQDIAQAAQVGYSTVKKYAHEIKEELAGQMVASLSDDEPLALALHALKDNPTITDEELAPILHLKRPASARFWRLKAHELLTKQQEAG